LPRRSPAKAGRPYVNDEFDPFTIDDLRYTICTEPGALCACQRHPSGISYLHERIAFPHHD
jgi:hypothetical protein